jgi:hypothetical protein
LWSSLLPKFASLARGLERKGGFDENSLFVTGKYEQARLPKFSF